MNTETKHKLGFGGGCHWCTEAVFQHLKGTVKVKQGYIASTGEASSFSEAVIVHFSPEEIPLKDLIEIHLHTHNSTSNHSFRKKYRSAIYFFSSEDETEIQEILKNLQENFNQILVTQVLPLRKFKASRASIQDYYYKNPEAPFCQRYIHPKLELLQNKFAQSLKPEVLSF